MNKARIRIDDLALLAYWNEPTGFDKTAIVVPGIPYETSLDVLTPFLGTLGFGVIQPQFIGTFDSAGKFSPENCIETILKLEKILRNHRTLFDMRNERDINVSGSIDLITGHSFGTYVVIGALLRGLTVDSAVLLSPMFEFGTQRNVAGIKVDMERHVRHISKALPLTFRMGSLKKWKHFFVSDSKFHPEPGKVSCARCVQILAITGGLDPSLDMGVSQLYVHNFVQRYSECLRLCDYIVVEKGTHDVNSLLTDTVKAEIRRMVGMGQ